MKGMISGVRVDAVQRAPTTGYTNSCMTHGRRNRATFTSEFSTVSDRILSGICRMTSNPMGPPMSWTTRWTESRPAASRAFRVQRARPLHV